MSSRTRYRITQPNRRVSLVLRENDVGTTHYERGQLRRTWQIIGTYCEPGPAKRLRAFQTFGGLSDYITVDRC